MRIPPARLASLGLAALLVVTIAPSDALGASRTAPGTSRAGRSLVVEGYVFGSASGAAAYRSDAKVVDIAGADGVTLTRDADGISRTGSGARHVLHATHRHGDTAELLVSNYSSALGDFDPDLGTRLLTSARRRSEVAAALAHVVRRDGWDGIQVDLESLPGSDRAGLVAFVNALRDALPARAGISMAVMAERSVASYHRHGYALRRLTGVDRFVLMAYDEHGPGWSGPGPVGALPWAHRTARALIGQVGARRTDLGIAGYGYVWTPSGGHQVTDARARAMAGDRATWQARAGEWTAKLGGGRTLWWSDARSYVRRLALARRLGVHGVAVWQLGSADPLRR